ncbi:hypothetical protein LOAG_05228 [Loa loa]|uniref:CX domain-containing protein n=1 Tax=Loa loa TaxID=7209 RepID=A0A1S0U0G4_LOALO|nr:hypothetical protein LOAG_05228 [Loa loa]EFO23258.1 hypothetical protein LOAG_05228 [Loa loa]
MRKGTYKDECQMMKGDKETDKQDGSRARSEERRAIWTQGSEVLLQKLISTTPSEIRKNLSGLIYHEKTNDGGYLCYYKNVASDNPITYLCNIGCCPNGCCVFQEVKRSGSYDLMIILLLIFVSAILFTAIAMLVIYYIYNRKSDERGYEFNGSFTEDSVVGSQVSGPPTYVGERRYLPHISPMKLF